MSILAAIGVGAVAVLHLWILVLEMFLWTKPIGRRVFGLSREMAEQTMVLAANQGLYNGFLAAGLIWGLTTGDVGVQLFFLACIIVAGAFGGITASREILLVQALPGLIAMLLVFLAH